MKTGQAQRHWEVEAELEREKLEGCTIEIRFIREGKATFRYSLRSLSV